MSELLIEQLSAFGDYAPTIPFAEGIDKDALIEGDSNPLFVTLPIAKVGAESKNGRIYGEQIVKAIVEQVNQRRNGGNKGHLRAEDRSSKFDLPVLQWVGATLDKNGMAYGKAYVPQYAQDVREYIQMKKATRSQIATSIYGTATSNGKHVQEIDIESIDLADPFRAGVSAAVATPIITSEMNIGDDSMSENQELISELRNDRNQALQEATELRVKLNTAQQQTAVIGELSELLNTQDVFKVVSEMQKQVSEWRPVIELLGDKPLQTIQEMKATIAELQQTSLIHTIVDAINEKVKFEGARPLIAAYMGIERNSDGIAEMTREYADAKTALTYLDSVLERDTVKEMIQSLVYKATGGRATSTKQYGEDWRDGFIERGKAKADQIVGGNR